MARATEHVHGSMPRITQDVHGTAMRMGGHHTMRMTTANPCIALQPTNAKHYSRSGQFGAERGSCADPPPSSAVFLCIEGAMCMVHSLVDDLVCAPCRGDMVMYQEHPCCQRVVKKKVVVEPSQYH